MGIRQWIDEHSAFASAAAMILVICAVGYLTFRVFGFGRSAGELPQKYWFYDLNDKKLFGDDSVKVAPFKTDEGHDAAKAVVYHCGSCSEPQKIAYLEKYTAKSKKRIEKLQEEMKANDQDPSMAFMRINQMGLGPPVGSYVSKADPIKWVHTAKYPAKAATIIGDLSRICPKDKKLVMNCFPE
ncbi:MAG: hypothetical protein QGH33_10515 [Pirellulaceae bacterium]|jgi:DNA-directed RNA polymerase subunit M/transcription elongation factor TFIIS|nr:hypothetical protein [Pirellulaceae bacterium]